MVATDRGRGKVSRFWPRIPTFATPANNPNGTLLLRSCHFVRTGATHCLPRFLFSFTCIQEVIPRVTDVKIFSERERYKKRRFVARIMLRNRRTSLFSVSDSAGMSREVPIETPDILTPGNDSGILGNSPFGKVTIFLARDIEPRPSSIPRFSPPSFVTADIHDSSRRADQLFAVSSPSVFARVPVDDNDALLLLQADSVPSSVKRAHAGSAISRALNSLAPWFTTHASREPRIDSLIHKHSA